MSSRILYIYLIHLFSFTYRSNGVTPPTTKSIPRSSTYEKISKPSENTNNATKQKQTPTSTIQSVRPRSTPSAVSKPVIKKSQPPASKPSGGARIVKPVTPRPKMNAITSKSLKQSNFSPFSDMRSYAISSGPSACISIERTSRNSQDGQVSIPLVTAPFVYGTEKSKNVEVSGTNGECPSEVCSTTRDKGDSESENSDREEV